MKLTLADLEKLEIAPELKADITELFGLAETKEKEITALRAKIPTDSQKVVSAMDHEKFVAATTELEKLKLEIAAKLETDKTGEGSALLAAFSPFFS